MEIAYQQGLVLTPELQERAERVQAPRPGPWAPHIEDYAPLNDRRRLNKYLEAVNARLPVGGTFAGTVYCASERKARLRAAYPKFLFPVVYGLDYAIHRVWPKLPGLRAAYFHLTKGRSRVVAEMEAIGRLYACGFKVLATTKIGNEVHFLAEKAGEPSYDMQATYGPLISLRRMGKNGRPIRIRKLRTMTPYSEYIQEYIFKRNGYGGGSGFKNDPRVTTAGRIFRKYWLDELPNLWNLLTGDVKLIGVRPVSQQYFELFPEEFRAYRLRFKPGLVPPLYISLPKTFEDIVQAEREYLEAYEKAPLLTDLRYFFRIAYSILVRKVRSA